VFSSISIFCFLDGRAGKDGSFAFVLVRQGTVPETGKARTRFAPAHIRRAAPRSEIVLALNLQPLSHQKCPSASGARFAPRPASSFAFTRRIDFFGKWIPLLLIIHTTNKKRHKFSNIA
jgi:hypothetical protein